MSKLEARVTKQFQGVADGDVYPKLCAVGDVITGELAQAAIDAGWAEKAEAAPAPAPVKKTADQAPVAPAPAPAPEPPFRAQTVRAVKHTEQDGRRVTIAKGAIVEGDLARALVTAGDAKALDGAPETKPAAAPETK